MLSVLLPLVTQFPTAGPKREPAPFQSFPTFVGAGAGGSTQEQMGAYESLSGARRLLSNHWGRSDHRRTLIADLTPLPALEPVKLMEIHFLGVLTQFMGAVILRPGFPRLH